MTYLFNYLAPSRHYHSWRHIGQMLGDLDKHFPQHRENDVLKMAIVYHDVVYDATAKNNEAMSARVAMRELSPYFEQDDLDEIHRLIMLTVDHSTTEADQLGKVIIDLDLARMGSEIDEYFENSLLIRREFGMFTDEQWCFGRRAFINKMLDKEYIFQTDYGRVLWETTARLNLCGELLHLNMMYGPEEK